MTMRHIIIEGPDGGGKTRLKEAVLTAFPSFLPHVRAADSLKGPVLESLANWVTDDLNSHTYAWNSWVYDRHPVISEPIYGPACRGGVPEMFAKAGWVSHMKTQLAHHCLLVICQPPLDVVIDHVKRDGDNQMPGVVDNIELIYAGYRHAMWPGAMIRYDYTSMSASNVMGVIGRVTGRRGR